MKKTILFLMLVILFGCSQSIEPRKQNLTKELLGKEVSKLVDFDKLVSSQKSNFENLNSLSESQKQNLLAIQPKLNQEVDSKDLQLTVAQIDKITKFQDWSGYISDFTGTLRSKYFFDDTFFAREFSMIIRDEAISKDQSKNGRTNFLDPVFLYYLTKLVECTVQCGNEAKEISSGDGSVQDETQVKMWQAGCIRGCVIYSGL